MSHLHSHLHFDRLGHAALITLDRPEALNALTVQMVTDMAAQLRDWAEDVRVKLVIISSSQSRAFCAGGDVREAVSMIKDNPDTGAQPYFTAEYQFDKIIATYPKPIVTLVDGVVMGGGLGLARLASHMVISSTIKLAMPETAIGLFPDVGASKFLRRLPVGAAMMMGMTGTIIGAGDVMAWSLADAHVPASAFDDVKQALLGAENEDDIAACLAKFETPPPDPDFALKQDAIDAVFTADNLIAIRDAASHYPDESWHDALTSRCPVSIAVFWYLMTHCPEPDTAADAIETDYFLAVRLTSRPDFTEGVRAVLIDKDNQPNWHPDTLEEMSEDFLETIFDFTAMSPLPA